MDTYNIIKQLTAKTDMISGESLKDNFKALLPIRDVHKGWGIYAGQWYFNFAPHEDYPHKEPYKLETDVFNEDERVGDVEAINKDVDKYNVMLNGVNTLKSCIRGTSVRGIEQPLLT